MVPKTCAFFVFVCFLAGLAFKIDKRALKQDFATLSQRKKNKQMNNSVLKNRKTASTTVVNRPVVFHLVAAVQ